MTIKRTFSYVQEMPPRADLDLRIAIALAALSEAAEEDPATRLTSEEAAQLLRPLVQLLFEKYGPKEAKRRLRAAIPGVIFPEDFN